MTQMTDARPAWSERWMWGRARTTMVVSTTATSTPTTTTASARSGWATPGALLGGSARWPAPLAAGPGEGHPATSGPARSMSTRMTTRRSVAIAERNSSQSGCSPATWR